jgi:hypothetical protein
MTLRLCLTALRNRQYRQQEATESPPNPQSITEALSLANRLFLGYSLAGCPPAEPASASATGNDSQLAYNGFSATSNNPLNSVSQPKGTLQTLPLPLRPHLQNRVAIFFPPNIILGGNRDFKTRTHRFFFGMVKPQPGDISIVVWQLAPSHP